ncbi:MAG: type II toxin-antitoxin system RnlA family toxin [Verrucomicrobia bacterium]|nr:type II toxin-antitoxin system RnlA family toxin [Verrucomicrobiota bacterium]
MDIIAVTSTLKELPEGAQIIVHTANSTLVGVHNAGWRRKENLDAWRELDEVTRTRTVTWQKESVGSIAATLAIPSGLTDEEKPDPAPVVRPLNGVARYVIADSVVRSRLRDDLTLRYAPTDAEIPHAEWAMRIAAGGVRVMVTQYSNGVLLVQGRQDQGLDEVCTAIEQIVDPDVAEVASRFLSGDQDEAERYVRLFSGQLVAEAEKEAKSQLGPAFPFIDASDRRYVISTFCLLKAGVELQEYSAFVMPLAKAFESFLKKLFLKVRLMSSKEAGDPAFKIGTVFDQKRPKTAAFLSKDRRRVGFLENLDSTLTFCRHFLMHGPGIAATEVNSVGESETHIRRIADAMRRTYLAWVAKD